MTRTKQITPRVDAAVVGQRSLQIMGHYVPVVENTGT